MWKWVLFAWEWKMISISKAEHLLSFWNRRTGAISLRMQQNEKRRQYFAACKRMRIPEPVKSLLVEAGILGFGIRNTSQAIRNPTNDWNPESKFHWQRLESSIQECLGFPVGLYNQSNRESLAYTAISRKVVRRRERNNPERNCG